MGLDAIVYRHINNLKIDNADKDKVIVDKESGEVYFETPELIEKYAGQEFTALHKRLGNADSIAAICEEITAIVGDLPSILRNRVLYSASHCGDTIDLGLLDQLQSEIDLVEILSAGNKTLLLKDFLKSMSALVEAAKEQKQPIVFT